MSLINDFKKEFNINEITDLDQDQLADILSSDKCKKFFTSYNKAINLIDELDAEIIDENIKKQLYVIKLTLSLSQNEAALIDTFTPYHQMNVTREELIERLNSLLKSEDPTFVLSTFVCMRYALPDYKPEVSKETMVEILAKMKEIFNKLDDLLLSYRIRCDLLDLIYQAAEDYFQCYDTPLDEYMKWVNDESTKNNLFEEQFISRTTADIAPEEIGLIDITKLKDDHENG